MPPVPQTITTAITRPSSAPPEKWTAYVANPLRIVLNSPDADLAGITELRAELHPQRLLMGQTPLAASPLLNPSGYSATLDFTAAQLNQDLGGAPRRTYWLLLRAIKSEGDPDIYQLGTLDLLAHPASDLAPPAPELQIYATTAFVTGSVDSLASGAMLDQDSRLKEIVSGSGYELTSITRDADNVVTTAVVLWPDGRPGVFTTLVKNTEFNVPDSFSITYVPAEGPTKTITQLTPVRNDDGAVITKPPLTIA